MHVRAYAIGCVMGVVFASGCASSPSAAPSIAPVMPGTGRAATAAANSAVPAFFNGQAVSIHLVPLSANAAQAVLAHNKNVNLIFEATGFLPVINEIQGPGFNPLWQVVDITFVSIAAKQFTSQADILAARDAHQIRLTFTNEVDSVPVVTSAGK